MLKHGWSYRHVNPQKGISTTKDTADTCSWKTSLKLQEIVHLPSIITQKSLLIRRQAWKKTNHISPITWKSSLNGIKAENNNLTRVSQSFITQKSGRVYCWYVSIYRVAAYRHNRLGKKILITGLILHLQLDNNAKSTGFSVQMIPDFCRVHYYQNFNFTTV